MELPDLIEALSRPEAYPPPVPAEIVVKQTHISVVFLVGDRVYKVKKPVDLGFLDFSTLELRRHFCEEETRLNRRLAPHVYLGVVPVTADGEKVRINGSGSVVEWAVEMVRLPDDATLAHLVEHGEVTSGEIEKLGRRIAEFHRIAETSPRIAEFGRFAVVAGNARENFEQSRGHVGSTVSFPVFERVRNLTEAWLTRLESVIESRAAAGFPRDTHGDLRLDHVYLFPDRPPPEDVVVIDCIEFSERFRFADPVADMAFLVMDFLADGRGDLAETFADAYFRESGDAVGRQLLRFYVAYRAVVRAKVDGMTAAEPEVPGDSRENARVSGRMHWLLALGQLAEPRDRPAIVLVGGLPGTGKSTLAKSLAESAEFEIVRSDVVRKDLAVGVSGPELYSPQWTDRTYTECLRLAEAHIFQGKRVLLDASFHENHRRQAVFEVAHQLAVPAVMLVCELDPGRVRDRLASRVGDASDADWAVHEAMAKKWEPIPQRFHPIDTTDATGARESAEQVLREAGLL